MSRLDTAEAAVTDAGSTIEAAIATKQTDLDRRRNRRRSILQRVAMLKARAERHGVTVPEALATIETLLATDEE